MSCMRLPVRLGSRLDVRPRAWPSRGRERVGTRALSSSIRQHQQASHSSLGNEAAAQDIAELETTSHTTPAPSETQIESFANHLRRRRLVPSRYHYRSPRYYRGPLHPHQPPPKTSPASREYIPGPFSIPRLMQTHQSVLESDLMTLFYQHIPPGMHPPPPAPRLRGWDGSSPYHKNRPLRGPRGKPVLPLLREMITYTNVPTMEKITVHSYLGQGAKDSEPTHAAGMVLQALTNSRATIVKATKPMPVTQRANHVQKRGKAIGIHVELRGEQMWHFLSTLLTVVLPQIKEWSGVKPRSGDRSGNYAIGLGPEIVSLWPEIAVNRGSYPEGTIPRLDIHLQTTAKSDRDGRILLSALGLPFISGGNR